MAEPESLCVYCRRRPIDPASRPFCSERCRMADLGRWLSGDYRVPVEDEGPVEGSRDGLDGQPEGGAGRERDN